MDDLVKAIKKGLNNITMIISDEAEEERRLFSGLKKEHLRRKKAQDKMDEEYEERILKILKTRPPNSHFVLPLASR